MEQYCLMVKSGGEEAFKKDFEDNLRREALKIADQEKAKAVLEAKAVFFKKKMRNAKKIEYQQPLFPGYVFMLAQAFDERLVSAAKKSRNFFHFLNSNADIQALQGKDREILSNLLKFGETQGISKAVFDKNQRIVIKSGPLLGFEGKIVKVNKKQGRATVQIDLCKNTLKFDLAFDEISLNESARTGGT